MSVFDLATFGSGAPRGRLDMLRPYDSGVRRLCLSAIALCGLALTRASFAGPPYLTDDPEPVDFRHWEIYLATVPTQNAAGWSGTPPQLETNYGAAPNLQLSLTIPLSFAASRGSTTHFGYGDPL